MLLFMKWRGFGDTSSGPYRLLLALCLVGTSRCSEGPHAATEMEPGSEACNAIFYFLTTSYSVYCFSGWPLRKNFMGFSLSSPGLLPPSLWNNPCHLPGTEHMDGFQSGWEGDTNREEGWLARKIVHVMPTKRWKLTRCKVFLAGWSVLRVIQRSICLRIMKKDRRQKCSRYCSLLNIIVLLKNSLSLKILRWWPAALFWTCWELKRLLHCPGLIC